jgi:glycosyltransferase involved in cell wall biosynthesis
MKIIFDLRRVGLGNNGGSSTLIKSGNTLVDMGHEVTFVDSGKNQHTWTPLKAKHIRPSTNAAIPSADFIIATGYKSVATTMQSPGRLGHKCHWIRGWETWQMSESKIIDNVLNINNIKLVNSICLQRKLAKLGYPSKIIRPGYDLDDIKPMARYPRKGKKTITLGGLYSKGKHWNIKRTQWIFDVHTELSKRYDVELWMFGNDAIPGRLVDHYFQRPDMNQKNYFFNNIDIWLSPAMQEGLHMPPAEAMMAGCPVVGTDADMSGTEDYLINEYNGLVSSNNFQSFSTNVEKLVSNETLRLELGNRARKSIEDLGDRKTNMQKLIDYFLGIIK